MLLTDSAGSVLQEQAFKTDTDSLLLPECILLVKGKPEQTEKPNTRWKESS